MSPKPSAAHRLKRLVLGKSRHWSEEGLFHHLSLAVMLAWVGLGSDGISSSCYGPEEAYKVLGSHPGLSLIVAALSLLAIFVISAGYSQIIGMFPGGGGGYVVAGRLLSPGLGAVSGCALLIDYVLTVTTSVVSAGDAIFSLAPAGLESWKWPAVATALIFLTLINLRGVKEAVQLWVPVFLLFLLTHLVMIGAAFVNHAGAVSSLPAQVARDWSGVSAEVGLFGALALVLRAFSMGAGTFTGIEAVSNGLPILREPRAATGRKTMTLMGVSLGVLVMGLFSAYLLCRVSPEPGKTLNATLLANVTAGWSPGVAHAFSFATLGSAALILLIAAQTGFLDGPRVLANMAVDRWMPSRFANLSDRYVTANGVLLIGGAALLTLALTHGSIETLVVLYSINVFITFTLSQLAMCRHWLRERGAPGRAKGLAINGTGLLICATILITISLAKFSEGGWVTLVVTALLTAAAFGIRAHYRRVGRLLGRLNAIVDAVASSPGSTRLKPRDGGRTAVILVNGFNGTGLHILLGAIRLMGGFKRYVFLSVGAVDAGNFKGRDEIDRLRLSVDEGLERYAAYIRSQGGEAECAGTVGHDVETELVTLAEAAAARHPDAVFFVGRLIFENDGFLTRLLHNQTATALQRLFHLRGLMLLILPIRVPDTEPENAETLIL